MLTIKQVIYIVLGFIRKFVLSIGQTKDILAGLENLQLKQLQKTLGVKKLSNALLSYPMLKR